MPLTNGGGLATGADVTCPERQMEEAHAGRQNFSRMSSAVGIWAACRSTCRLLGSAQEAATTSGVRRRSHTGLRLGGGGQELADGLPELERDLLVPNLWGRVGVGARGFLAGRSSSSSSSGLVSMPPLRR